jgi:hypothetical protein
MCLWARKIRNFRGAVSSTCGLNYRRVFGQLKGALPSSPRNPWQNNSLTYLRESTRKNTPRARKRKLRHMASTCVDGVTHTFRDSLSLQTITITAVLSGNGVFAKRYERIPSSKSPSNISGTIFPSGNTHCCTAPRHTMLSAKYANLSISAPTSDPENLAMETSASRGNARRSFS